MSESWNEARPDAAPRPGFAGGLRVMLRGPALVLLVFGGLGVLLVLRLAERPLCGLRRPVTPHVTKFVCRNALRILGIELLIRGHPMGGQGAMVANHSSWLDIFVLNAVDCIYFVSKSEVAGWPGIGWLARATGTLFIRRDRREARAQTALLESRLLAGHRLLFFPEGTSTDGLQVLPFKSTLFQAFLSPALKDRLAVQPASVFYAAPPLMGEAASPRFHGWWGEMDFAPHLLKVLAAPRGGRVGVILHAPLRVGDFADRKALAAQAGAAVEAGHRELREHLIARPDCA